MINSQYYLKNAVIIFILFVGAIGCSSNEKQTEAEHLKEVNAWHQVRIDNLLGPEDWLKLAGLYELEEGRQSFGADSTNDLVFPPKAAPTVGTITKKDTTITLQVHDDVVVTHNQDTVSEITIIPGNARSGTVLKHQSLIWYLIDRRGTYYIRLVDEEHPNLTAFDGIQSFPIDSKWRIKAAFNPFDDPKPITVPDVLNEGIQDTLYGMLEFFIDGEKYKLAPLNHPKKDDKFFIIFGDKTNGKSTYGGGRYIYIPTPNKDNITYIDFNKAYNPPCVFTEHATCPLPPSQNKLDIAIPAGEKMFEEAQTY